MNKIEDLRAAVATARTAAEAQPDDATLAEALKGAEAALAEAETAAAKAKPAKAPTAKAPTEKAPVAKAPADQVKVRVIGFHPDHAINDVPLLTADEVVAAKRDGWGDDSPEAVAYAESLSAS